MMRYHFNTSNGLEHPDTEGTELGGLAEARVEAVKVLSDFMRGDAQGFWSTELFSVTCTDDEGLALFRLDVTTTAAPATMDVAAP